MAAMGVQVLTFRVGDSELAAPVEDVRQVFRDVRITRVPQAPNSLAGVASLRGVLAPVVSVARLLGQTESAPAATARVILLGARDPVAILVDEVGALDRLDWDEADGPDGLGRLYLRDQDAVRTIDLAALLRRAFRPTERAVAASASAQAPAAAEPAAPEVALLAFELAGQAYALPLAAVDEVLAAPKALAALPHTDAAMAGVMAVRDALVPVVSLRTLLGLETEGPLTGGRIIVARIGASRVGLRVDVLRAIVRTHPDRIDATPSMLNRGAGEARIDAICRLPDGGGLVSILSPDQLFRAETYAQILADGRQTENAMDTSRDAEARVKILVFRLGEESYGLPISDVDEVLRLPPVLTRVPKAPAFVLGVMPLRGRLLPVIDQHQRFGVAGAPPAAGRRVIVTTVGDRQAGFVVDAVSEILDLPSDQLAPTSTLTAEAGQVFDRMANLEIDGRIILVVDPQALLDRAERDLLSAFDQGAGPVTP
jgi:purine-binding chemotaxis protein CheW